MADLSLPKVSINPSKIKDRWGLGALGFIIWLFITYFVLNRPGFNPWIIVTIIILTFALLALALMLSFSKSTESARLPAPSPNILPARRPGASTQKVTVQEIIFLGELMELSQDPEVRRMLDKRFGGKS